MGNKSDKPTLISFWEVEFLKLPALIVIWALGLRYFFFLARSGLGTQLTKLFAHKKMWTEIYYSPKPKTKKRPVEYKIGLFTSPKWIKGYRTFIKL